MERILNISIALVNDLKIRQRRHNEILGVCPICFCRDANFNTAKLVWNCFERGSLVLTNYGYLPIERVRIGMLVLSENGKYQKVIKTFKNKVSKSIRIKSKQLTRDIVCTPNHIFYVYDGGVVIEKEASDINKSDLLVYPITSETYDCDTLSVKSSSISKYFGSIIDSYNIKVTDEFLQIAGLYLAEGSSSYGQVSFSFGTNEKDLIDFVCCFFSRYGFIPKVYTRGNSTNVKICSVYLSCIFGDLFGRGSENKVIPWQLMRLPPYRAKKLLDGILLGDGYETSSKCWSNRLGQTSEILCMQMKQIASYCGFNCSGYCAKDYYKNTRKPTYINWISNSDVPNNYNINRRIGLWFTGIKVDGVSDVTDVDDYYYDLAVENSHKYTVNGVFVHNCWHGNHSGRIIPEEGYEIQEVEEVTLDIPKVRNLYTKLADRYHQNMTQPVLDYLQTRGLTHQAIDNFKLGFCSTDFCDEYSDELVEDAGVIYQNYPILTNRITIPYLANGEVVDLRGRTLDGVFTYKNGTPTYTSLVGNRVSRGATFLFNHDIIDKNDTIILTEGEFKAMVAHQHGFAIVATPGIFGWQKEWSRLLKDKNVILAADFDRVVGLRSPAYLMAKMLSRELPQLKVALLEIASHTTKDKIDIDSLIINGHLKMFERAIKGAMDVNWWLRREETIGYGRR